MAQSAVVPRGQVPIPPEVSERLKELKQLKGGLTGFTNRAGIKSDTLRLAIKRGTTTERTLLRITTALEKSGGPLLTTKSRAVAGNGHVDAAVRDIGQLPPDVVRRIQRVSGALLDGMQLMQLTVLKVLQEEIVDSQEVPVPPRQIRSK